MRVKSNHLAKWMDYINILDKKKIIVLKIIYVKKQNFRYNVLFKKYVFSFNTFISFQDSFQKSIIYLLKTL